MSPDKDWNRRLVENAGRATVRHRRWRVVAGLTVLTVMAAIAGLVADTGLDKARLAHGCYATAGVAGLVLMVFLFSRRLRVTRRP